MEFLAKKLLWTAVFICFLAANSANATPILSINPSSTAATLRSDGLAIIAYTVTNNTNQLINNFLINPGYQTTGLANNISLGSINTCTGNLAANSSCNFNVQILGANQPNSFQVSPQVCGFGGIFCSTPLLSQYVYISTNTVGTTYAYFSVSSGSNINTVVPVDTITLEVGIPLAVAYTIANGLAVSPDGTRVYAGEQNNDDESSIVILTSGPNPQLIQIVSLGYFPYLEAITASPNGKTVYVTASESQTLYRIDNIAGTYIPTLITLPPDDSASGLAVSPDSTRVFITSYATNALYVMDAGNNTVIQTLTNSGTTCEFNAPGSIVVSPDGNTIYVANGYGAEGISVIQKNNGTYNCGSRITSPSQQLVALAMSPNGQFLYATGDNSPQQLYIIDTATNTQIASYTIPDNSAGVAVTPDGSKLFISNSGAFSYSYALVNGLPSGAITAINIGGGSQTQGNFSG